MEELDEEEQQHRLMQRERDRVQERLTLKHRGKGKWAKRLLQRGNVDTDTRRALNQQQQIAQDLLQKKDGGVGAVGADGDGDGDDDDGFGAGTSGNRGDDELDLDSDFDEEKESGMCVCVCVCV